MPPRSVGRQHSRRFRRSRLHSRGLRHLETMALGKSGSAFTPRAERGRTARMPKSGCGAAGNGGLRQGTILSNHSKPHYTAPPIQGERSMPDIIKIYVGYDSREDIAWQV